MMSKFLEQVEDEMAALTGDIPSQDMKLSLKDLLNKKEGWKALPTNTTSGSTKDQLRVTWNDQVFIVDIKHVPAEDGEVNPKKMEALSTLLNVNTPKIAIPGTVSAEVKKTQKTALRDIQKDLKG